MLSAMTWKCTRAAAVVRAGNRHYRSATAVRISESKNVWWEVSNLEEILALAKKVAEEAEVYLVSNEETPVHFESNRLKNIQYKQSQSVALRVIKNGKIGYATSTSMENAQQLVDDAAATAEFGMKAEFQFPATKAFPEVTVFDAAVEKVSLEK